MLRKITKVKTMHLKMKLSIQKEASNLATLVIYHLSKNSYLQTAEALITSKEEMPNSIKIEKRNIFHHYS